MTSFFDKLNLVVRARINELLDEAPLINLDRSDSDTASVSGDLTKDVASIRRRLNEALEYESELQAKIDSLYAQIADWDQKADQAVSANQDDDARFAMNRLQHAQRQLEMTEADLREHRFITQDLMRQLNNLEAVIDEVQNRAVDEAESPQPLTSSIETVGRTIGDLYAETQQKLNELITRGNEMRETPVERETDDSEIDTPQTADDLSERRSRLSKPDKND